LFGIRARAPFSFLTTTTQWERTSLPDNNNNPSVQQPPLYSSVCVLPFDLSPSPKWVLYGLTVEPPLSTRLDSNAP
jgi:hypothetical protein